MNPDPDPVLTGSGSSLFSEVGSGPTVYYMYNLWDAFFITWLWLFPYLGRKGLFLVYRGMDCGSVVKIYFFYWFVVLCPDFLVPRRAMNERYSATLAGCLLHGKLGYWTFLNKMLHSFPPSVFCIAHFRRLLTRRHQHILLYEIALDSYRIFRQPMVTRQSVVAAEQCAPIGREWRRVQFFALLPGVGFLLLYYFLLPRSIRWGAIIPTVLLLK